MLHCAQLVRNIKNLKRLIGGEITLYPHFSTTQIKKKTEVLNFKSQLQTIAIVKPYMKAAELQLFFFFSIQQLSYIAGGRLLLSNPTFHNHSQWLKMK